MCGLYSHEVLVLRGLPPGFPGYPGEEAFVSPRKRLPSDHGTMRAYRYHLADGETPCDACRDHRREIEANRPNKEQHKANNAKKHEIRRRALNRLAKLIPNEFRAILEEERIKYEEEEIMRIYNEVHIPEEK